MELGPLQKMWLSSLRSNPEKQRAGVLATFKDENNLDDYRACCLGEYLLCKLRMDNLDIKQRLTKKFGEDSGFALRDVKGFDLNNNNKEFGNLGSTGTVTNFRTLKLRSIVGYIDRAKLAGKVPLPQTVIPSHSLAELNDAGITWVVIADFIENNPESVFTGSI